MLKSFTSLLRILPVVLAICACAAWAQPPDTLWTKVYGGTGFDAGNCGIETADGNFVAVGRADLPQPAGTEIYLVKMNSVGDTLWTKFIGGTGTQVGNFVRQTMDGGYIIAGLNNLGSSNDAYVVKTNDSGDTTWTKTFGTLTGDEQFFCIQELAVGGYIATGHAYSDTGTYDVSLYRLSALGVAQWNRSYGGASMDIGRYVVQTADQGFAILGYTLSSGAGGMDMYFIKTGPTGLTPVYHTYGGTDWDYGRGMELTDDGGFILTGETKSFGVGAGTSYDGWLVKTDAAGDTMWTRTFGARTRNEIPWSVSTHPDGGYVIAGESETVSNGKDVWTIKTDANGDSLWGAFYGGPSNDIGNSVFVTEDQGYFYTGQTQSFGAGSYDFYLVRLEGPPLPQIVVDPLMINFDSVMVDSSESVMIYITNIGQVDLVLGSLTTTNAVYITDYDPADSVIVPGDTLWVEVTFTPTDTLLYEDTLLITNNDEDIMVDLSGQGYVLVGIGSGNVETLPSSYALHSAVPNPFNPSTSIGFDLPRAGQVKLDVFDSNGRLAATLVDRWMAAGTHNATFDGTSLASGVYICRLTAGNFEAAAKLVLMK